MAFRAGLAYCAKPLRPRRGKFIARFRIGITRDVLDATGAPTFGTAPFALLNRPELEWEYVPELTAQITPAHLGAAMRSI